MMIMGVESFDIDTLLLQWGGLWTVTLISWSIRVHFGCLLDICHVHAVLPSFPIKLSMNAHASASLST